MSIEQIYGQERVRLLRELVPEWSLQAVGERGGQGDQRGRPEDFGQLYLLLAFVLVEGHRGDLGRSGSIQQSKSKGQRWTSCKHCLY